MKDKHDLFFDQIGLFLSQIIKQRKTVYKQYKGKLAKEEKQLLRYSYSPTFENRYLF